MLFNYDILKCRAGGVSLEYIFMLHFAFRMEGFTFAAISSFFLIFICHLLSALRQEIPYQLDHALFERLIQGDEVAFEKLVHTLYKKLFPFTVSLIKSENEANDVLQDVFLKIWLHRSSFSAIENPMGWIYTVVANTASNYLRTKLRHELRIKAYQSQSVVAAGMEEQLDANFTQSLIDEAVNKLPAKRKQVFLLSRKEGLSRKEIATRLNVSENTVRNQLVEALQFVREYLTQRGGLTVPAILILMEML